MRLAGRTAHGCMDSAVALNNWTLGEQLLCPAQDIGSEAGDPGLEDFREERWTPTGLSVGQVIKTRLYRRWTSRIRRVNERERRKNQIAERGTAGTGTGPSKGVHYDRGTGVMDRSG